MKAIIPVAGVGTRMKPHTHTAPKVLLRVAGKPMLGHILDELVKIGVEEVTLIVGYYGDKVIDYVNSNYHFRRVNYVWQEERRGLGHAIWMTKKHHRTDEPVLIILGDTIFRADFKKLFQFKNSVLGVKEVEDPRRFGIAQLDESGTLITRLVEKPTEYVGNLALVGIYYITQSKLMFKCLDLIIRKDIRTRGEFQITDALQEMISQGAAFVPFRIEGWYDCGKPETLLETNRVLLDLFKAKPTASQMRQFKDSVILPPVSIHPSAKICHSIIGPHVDVAEGTSISHSIISDSIISSEAIVSNMIAAQTIIGNGAIATGVTHQLNVGDNSEIHLA
ncbi:NTP transferase domain-containing protein [Candidatus Sumerlaeota bacterium]|nr:NTP transferase domain-containing protein [Candidatus Sumerlaeota bacterium]